MHRDEVTLNTEPPTWTAKLHGRTVEAVYRHESHLAIKFTDGHVAVIGWYDGHRPVRGEPRLRNIDVTVTAGMQ